jgi:hypothetical protein
MAINAFFIIQEDGGKAKKSGEQVYEGSPLTIDANTGLLRLALATEKVYGLSKLDSNQYHDFAFGEFGAFGSGQLDVVTRGQCEISHTVYNKVEVDTETTTGNAPIVKKLFDDTKTYQAMDPLYVDGTGLITNAPGAGKASLLGKCLIPLAPGLSPLTLELDPSATHTTSEMA